MNLSSRRGRAAASTPETWHTAAVMEMREVTRVHGSGETAVQALNGVSMAIYPGELVAVMGPSGSGKSTLLNLTGAMDTASTGQVFIEGHDLATLNASELAALRRRHCGVVFQDYNLIPSLTALENIALPLELDGMRGGQARRLAKDALARVGIKDLADRFPDSISGGQQQRIAIARAIVGQRRLILADEPTGALDTNTGEEVLRVLRGLCDEGASGLLVTHEARHAAWADRVIFLRDGAIVDETVRATSAESLLNLPQGAR